MSQSALLMIISSFFFALMGVCVRLASQTVPVTEIVLFRSVIGLFLIIPMIIVQRVSFIGRRPLILIIRGVTGFVALSLYFFAISKIPLATAVMLNYTSPLFVAFMAPFVLREHFNLKIFLIILLGFVGVLLIVKPQHHTDLFGALMGLVSGVFAAGAYLSIGALRKDHSSLTIVFYFFWISTILSIPFTWASFKMPTLHEFIYLSGTGVFATVAQILMTRALRLGETATTSAYASSIVLFSLTFGVIFWKEIPTLISIIGGILVVTSVVLISQMERTEVLSTEP
jgi:drug/metabolite transporter (DMT)-like permease